MQENAIDCHFQDHSVVSLKSEIIDAHGKQRTVLTEYNNIACVNKVKVPDLKLDQLNEKMITFDLIQLSKNIRNIIEQHSLYYFDIDLIKKYLKHELLEIGLNYMMKTKVTVLLDDVKGHIILKKETYFLQPQAIEDQKITLSERAVKPKQYVKRILIDKEYKTDKNDINDVIEKRISDLRVDIKKVVKDVKLGIL